MTDDAPAEPFVTTTEPEAPAAPPTTVQVTVRLTMADFERVKEHRDRLREENPMQLIGLANALRDFIHRGIRDLDAEVLAASEEKGAKHPVKGDDDDG